MLEILLDARSILNDVDGFFDFQQTGYHASLISFKLRDLGGVSIEIGVQRQDPSEKESARLLRLYFFCRLCSLNQSAFTDTDEDFSVRLGLAVISIESQSFSLLASGVTNLSIAIKNVELR